MGRYGTPSPGHCQTPFHRCRPGIAPAKTGCPFPGDAAGPAGRQSHLRRAPFHHHPRRQTLHRGLQDRMAGLPRAGGQRRRAAHLREHPGGHPGEAGRCLRRARVHLPRPGWARFHPGPWRLRLHRRPLCRRRGSRQPPDLDRRSRHHDGQPQTGAGRPYHPPHILCRRTGNGLARSQGALCPYGSPCHGRPNRHRNS